MDVPQEPSSSQGRKEKEIDVGLVAKDGAIGCYKNGSFQAMTNFSIACKGFVSCGSAVEGYLIQVIPANCQFLDGGQGPSQRYVLAWVI